VTVRLVLARWPEKPWLHENRKIRWAAYKRPLQLAATFSPLVIDLFPTVDAFGKAGAYIIVEYSKL
jgi:hypothetical protein